MIAKRHDGDGFNIRRQIIAIPTEMIPQAGRQEKCNQEEYGYFFNNELLP